MATFLTYKPLNGAIRRQTTLASGVKVLHRPVLAPVANLPARSNCTASAPSWVVRAEPSDREHNYDASDPIETASVNRNKSREVSDNLVADVDSPSTEQESAADRIGSDAAASEKAPDSERNQEYQEPLAGEGVSAAD